MEHLWASPGNLPSASLDYTVYLIISRSKSSYLEYWLLLRLAALGVGDSPDPPSIPEVDPVEATDCRFRLSKVLAIFFQNFILTIQDFGVFEESLCKMCQASEFFINCTSSFEYVLNSCLSDDGESSSLISHTWAKCPVYRYHTLCKNVILNSLLKIDKDRVNLDARKLWKANMSILKTERDVNRRVKKMNPTHY